MEKYWRGLDEYKHGPDRKAGEAAEYRHKGAVMELMDDKITGASATRRDFLKLVGFSFTTAALASSCEKPVQKAIPYLIKPEEVTPGKSSYYATGFFDGSEYCSVVAKVRDGRPIKIEANKLSPVSLGGTSARVQASILGLYDEARYQGPMKGRKSISWEELDGVIIQKLEENSTGKKVLLTSTLISPSTEKLIGEMQSLFPGLEWIQYDEISASGLRMAHQLMTGKDIIPGYRFDKADYILSFESDFLGTWLDPVAFSRGYAGKRSVGQENSGMSKHVQFESGYSLTGSNADERVPVNPILAKAVLAKMYNQVASSKGEEGVGEIACDFDVTNYVQELLDHEGSSIVISGSNDTQTQMLVAGLNLMLGNYGKTLDTTRAVRLKRGDDAAFFALEESLDRKEVSMLLMYNVNPVYSSGKGEKLKDAITGAPLSVFIGSSFSETALASQYICPDHHFLEAWGDAEPVIGSYSLQQPTIHPIYNTRSFQDSLLNWIGSEGDYYTYLKRYWEKELYPRSGTTLNFRDWWNRCLQDGVVELNAPAVMFKMEKRITDITLSEVEGLTLSLYTPVGVTDGRQANNPWLQELPDPITKVCWDNYLSVSLSDATALGLETEDVVLMNGIEIPVLVQPGQAQGTVSVALGYGRTLAGKVAENIGVNVYRFVTEGSTREYVVKGVSIEKTGKRYSLAMTQTHHSMEERPIVRETTLSEYREDPYAGNHDHLEAEKHHKTMYPDTKFDGYHWGLNIDLNKCVGCNNCIVSCIAENNIATVGKEEVKKRRIMHWLRIDRYYSGNPENPKVYHQPVMCQHCDNAPCENVCPVSATMHSNEGLNQIAYVRCIGTKYCINNCPYRVRRFNWFKYIDNDDFNYHLNSDMSKLVLNPDVTVRERGVVEKCSLCVQRIQEKKMEAKLQNRELKDEEIQPACVQSCPSGALVFGNMNDKNARVTKEMEQERNYYLLEQLHTLPSVGYLTKVRNIDPEAVKQGSDPEIEKQG